MTIEANFKGSFEHPNKNSICVLTVISMNSEKQSGDNFKAFLWALNKQYELGRVHKLIIAVSGGLHLHYIKLDKKLTEEQTVTLANDMDNRWITNNQEALKCLKFDYQIVTWDKLLENKEEFQTFLEQVKSDYNFKDKAFKNKVLKHSGKYYAEKLYVSLKEKLPDIKLSDCQEAAINYVLDECAVLITLDRWADYLVYPGKMNPCANHIYKNYFSSEGGFLKYNEYILAMPKKLAQIENKVTSTSFTNTTEDIYEKRFFRNSKQLEKQILCSTKTLLKRLDDHERLKFFYYVHNLNEKTNKKEKINTGERELWQRRLSLMNI